MSVVEIALLCYAAAATVCLAVALYALHVVVAEQRRIFRSAWDHRERARTKP